ncbi:ABC transporter permease [Tardiphaga alba]|uniref:ABC transporter permease n=1 Tax=Tardiphaga alba TaxID=340268 RepID=UPI001BA4B828|nr:ABC transporter permease [Tardiphaga alba]
MGVLFAEFRWLERLLYPFVLGLQSMPKVALAPLILVWFGFGLGSKAVMVGLVCFFPMFINTAVGLKATDPSLLDLMRAFSASRWHVLTRIKIPSAASHIFAGLQISIVLGLIGAVVAEFVSSSEGLGFLINAATTTLDTSTMFAALISLAVLGIGGSQIIKMLQHRLVFWDRSGGMKSLSE